MRPFEIHQIPLWEDNYIYIFIDKATSKTAVVDPGSAEPVNQFLQEKRLRLDLILSTHHHYDHIGGNLELKEKWACPVYGFAEDRHRIPGIDIGLYEGDLCSVGNTQFEVLFLPGHTLGHIAFLNPQNHILFCGDTLFAMGCGRLFEGSREQMFSSLQKIKKLPPKTQIYCAHEYSLKNARFALSLEPENQDLQKRFQKISALRKKNKPTVPFELEEELLTNPFLRSSSLAEFSHRRELRDSF